jgi:UTP--glucose-1-phosphate uridylyltransferase
LEPAGDVPALGHLPGVDGSEALGQVALIKLNGGLATTMGLRSPKSLVEARDGHSFLDIIIGQTLGLRRRHEIRLPLVLMNSQATREETLSVLTTHPELADGLPPDFLQSMIPKLDADTLAPISWPPDPALEWCPPGHGDVYGALRRSGMLAQLLERGFEYAMISNSDNLGATLDPRIAGFLADQRIPFLMEVVEGTEATARAATSLAVARTDSWCCVRRRRPHPRTRSPSGTIATGATTTRTTCGSICACSPRRWSSAAACSSCR